jgi:hypothetical protein
LPRFPKDEGLTYQKLAAQSSSLRDWYFQKSGGIYLSSGSQKLYLRFQQTIQEAVQKEKANQERPVSAGDYDRAMKAGSALRTSLTNDLHSRSEWGIF